eukprot:gene11208-23420_t
MKLVVIFLISFLSIYKAFRPLNVNIKLNLIKNLHQNVSVSTGFNGDIESPFSVKGNRESNLKPRYSPSSDLSRKSKYSPVKRRLRSDVPAVKAQHFSTMGSQLNHHNVHAVTNDFKSALYQASTGQPDIALSTFLSLTNHKNLTIKECNLMLKELGDAGYLDHCAQLLVNMTSLGIRPTVVTYSTLISRAGAWQKTALAEKYYKQMIYEKIPPDVQAFNSLINAYAKTGDTDAALHVLHDMDKAHILPSIVTFNTLLDSCSRKGNVSRAKEMFQLIITHDIKPNLRSYSSLIHACCQAGEINEAILLLKYMEEANIPPSAVTYSMLLHGMGQSGDLLQAFQLLDSMKSKGIRPNVVTMSSLVHSCAKHGHLELAFSLYDKMSESIHVADRPNSITCSSLVDACLKSGHIDRAFTVIGDMRSWGVALTQVTYTSLISELTRLGELDRILDVIQGEPAEGVPPAIKLPNGNAFFPTSAKSIIRPTSPPTTATSTIEQGDGVSKLGRGGSKTSTSSSSLSSSSSSSSSLSHSPWSESLPKISPEVSKQLVNLLSKAQRVDAALDVLEGIVHSQSLPPRETVELVVSAVAGAKELGRAVGLVHKVTQLLRDNPSKDQRSSAHYEEACFLLLRASSRADGLLRAYEVFSEVTKGQAQEGSYAALMEACRQGRNHDTVVKLFESMKDDGVTPGPLVYQTLMQSMYEDCRRRSDQAAASKQMPADELF